MENMLQSEKPLWRSANDSPKSLFEKTHTFVIIATTLWLNVIHMHFSNLLERKKIYKTVLALQLHVKKPQRRLLCKIMKASGKKEIKVKNEYVLSHRPVTLLVNKSF